MPAARSAASNPSRTEKAALAGPFRPGLGGGFLGIGAFDWRSGRWLHSLGKQPAGELGDPSPGLTRVRVAPQDESRVGYGLQAADPFGLGGIAGRGRSRPEVHGMAKQGVWVSRYETMRN